MVLAFLAVALITGLNLVHYPFTTAPTVWGAILAAFFIWTNYLADKYKMWIGIVWFIISAVIAVYVLSGRGLDEAMRITVSTFSFVGSLFYAHKHYKIADSMSCK